MFSSRQIRIERVLEEARVLWRQQSRAAAELSRSLRAVTLAAQTLAVTVLAGVMHELSDLSLVRLPALVLTVSALMALSLSLRGARAHISLPRVPALRWPLLYRLSLQAALWAARAGEFLQGIRVPELVPQFELPQMAAVINAIGCWMRGLLPAPGPGLAREVIAYRAITPGHWDKDTLHRAMRAVVLRC